MNLNAQRVLVILREIAKSSDGVGVRELARSLGQSPSNIQKGLQALRSK
jgi:DNA-binding IclR family transcriptional regulator